MILLVIGSIMTNPIYEQLGYAVSEVFTVFSLLISGAFALVMRSNRGFSGRLWTYGIALAVSILCWLIFWLQQPFGGSDRGLLNLVALHGLFWGTRCVALATRSEAISGKSLLFALIGAAACSTGIFLATRSEMSKLMAVTIAGCYMLCLGLQLFFVSFLLHRELATGRVIHN